MVLLQIAIEIILQEVEILINNCRVYSYGREVYSCRS